MFPSRQRVTRLTLGELGDAPVANPSIIVVGEVAARSVLGHGRLEGEPLLALLADTPPAA